MRDGDGLTGHLRGAFSSSGDVRWLAVVGFASMLLLSMLVPWASASGLLFERGASAARSLFSEAQNVAFSLSFFLLFFAFTCTKRRWPANNAPLAAAMGALLLVVGGVLAVFALGVSRAPLVALVGGAAVGVALALGYVLWQQVFSLQPNRPAAIEVVLGSALAGGVFFAIVWLPPGGVLACAVGFAVVTCATLAGFFVLASPRGTRVERSEARLQLALCIRENWTPVLVMSLLGLVWGIFGILAARNAPAGFLSNLYALGRILAAALAFAYFAGTRFSLNLNVFPQVVFPVCITAALLYPLFGAEMTVAIATAYYVVFGLLSIAMIPACAAMARRYRLHPSTVYCLFFGLIYLFSKIGLFVGRAVTRSAADIDSLTFELFVALAVVYLFAMLSFCIQKRRMQGRDRVDGAEDARTLGAADGFAGTAEGSPVVGSPSAHGEDLPVERLADYGLTPREYQVARLLAKGRDIPYICDELSLSKNTVRTHIRNVYQKTGVHSKQELISLSEDEAR